MSSTRRTSDPDAFHQERYCSSEAFTRGLLGNLVSQRCELLAPEDRKLIYFLQLLSHRDGGLEGIVQRLIDQRQRPGQPQHVTRAEKPLSEDPVVRAYELQIRKAIAGEVALDQSRTRRAEEQLPSTLRRDLANLCVNPESEMIYREQLTREYSAFAANAATSVVTTEIGRMVNDALDYTVEHRCLTLIDGLERIGKTFAVKAWIEQHPGEARYVQATSTPDDSGWFRAVAKSLGVAAGNYLKARELRSRIEETLQRGHLMLVIDEGHYLFSQVSHNTGPPGRINWLLTALVNYGVPVAICATPQFFENQEQVVKRSRWRFGQLAGRWGHRCSLPSEMKREDMERITRHLLPSADDDAVDLLVFYGDASKRFAAGIHAVIERATYLANRLGGVPGSYLPGAIRDCVLPSDPSELHSFVEKLSGSEGKRRDRSRITLNSN